MLKIKCDINQQYLKTVDLHFVKSESFSLTWSCGSRQRDTTSSGWKFSWNNLAVKGLTSQATQFAAHPQLINPYWSLESRLHPTSRTNTWLSDKQQRKRHNQSQVHPAQQSSVHSQPIAQDKQEYPVAPSSGPTFNSINPFSASTELTSCK